ncbi:MAG: YggS family pyridoxal phosphate-dependent enzyme [Agathobacter sp.]|nr:YggS family pyridoxal phosphate-dependent enzyme [Agathobacter sp.]
MIKENLYEVEQNIRTACEKSGRNRDEITLIAVSKTKPVPLLEEAYITGIRNFGENKVQEMCDKYEVMEKDICWHMIGHLQTNKVKYLIGKTALIHSVDSYKLACEIEKQAAKHNCVMDILIEVNIAEEESKFGLSEEEVIHLVKEVAKMPHVRIKGLMTVAPYVVDSEENRPFFRKIKQLSVDIDNENIDNVSMNILSMGMTGDYMVAIEEGATMVRVGTGIFGERDYNKQVEN